MNKFMKAAGRCGVAAALVFAGVSSDAEAGDGSGMVVGRRGADFYVSGLPFKHVGANIPQLVWMPAWQVQQELDYAAASGVKQVRVFLPNDAQTCYTFDGVYHNPCTTSDVIARLRYVVDEAYKRYLRVTVALAHNYHQDVWGWEKGNRYNTAENPVRHAWGADGRPNQWFDGSTGFYTRNYNGLMMLNDSWIDWGYGAYYKPTVQQIVGAFQNHPGIFAWDIANEVNSTDPTQWWIPNFYKNMAAAIRLADPTHLITTGLISSSWAVANDTLRDAIYNDANIDYMTVHMYDGCGTTLNSNAQMDDLWRARNRYDKPIVIEENGFQNGTTDGISKARSFYNDRFAGDVNWRANAILQWGWTANETAENWGTGDTDCAPRVQGKQREYRALMGRWGGQLDTRLPLIVDSDANYNAAVPASPCPRGGPSPATRVSAGAPTTTRTPPTTAPRVSRTPSPSSSTCPPTRASTWMPGGTGTPAAPRPRPS